MYLDLLENPGDFTHVKLVRSTKGRTTYLDVIAKQSAYRNCANKDSANPSSTSVFSDMSYSATRRWRAAAISSWCLYYRPVMVRQRKAEQE